MSETQEVIAETLDVIEDTLDMMEGTLDTMEKVKFNRRLAFLAVGLVCFSAGAAISYFVAKKRFNDIAKVEIEEAKQYYSRMTKPASPSALAQDIDEDGSSGEELQELITDYQSEDEVEQARSRVEEVTGRTVEVRVPKDDTNIFIESQTSPNFNYAEEVKLRTEDDPYVITVDEYEEGERDFEQISLTYYEEDDLLVDDGDQAVADVDIVVGQANLNRFGHGSKDNNIVYIRNEHLETDFEVCRAEGSFARHLGFIEHSYRDRRSRKFRDYDD